ncbi:hypothetical protein CYLTODRAFT_414111 [Cylindrobasidium torrendii FP15055 ss-10]|uniref:Uncharacterized protein n=1 Tax=Cylindrobasidium torrendii FP15055 ss-10 TaxID=1314674 RepID=A0A0D7AZJ5_9AGAR|nr:hypothetical protein CYLTODRAFT_414111 [Cylindrobasidium torrendii FP15055 ss-10]
MNSSLPLDCFSLSIDFSSPVIELQYAKSSASGDRLLDKLEYFYGMQRGDSEQYMSSELNTIKCRTDFAALLTSGVDDAKLFLFLKRTKATVQRLQRLVTRNSEAKIEKRLKFDEKFPLGPYGYRFVYLDFKQTIYVRDPTTGEIIGHDAPYNCMPKITSTLNPCFWAIQTATISVVTAASLHRGTNRWKGRISGDFNSPVLELQYFQPSDSDDRLLDRLEFFNGMERGDSERYLTSELNIIKCQKDFAGLLTSAVEDARLFLFPKKTKATVQRLQRLATRNLEAQLEKRSTFEKEFPLGL